MCPVCKTESGLLDLQGVPATFLLNCWLCVEIIMAEAEYIPTLVAPKLLLRIQGQWSLLFLSLLQYCVQYNL